MIQQFKLNEPRYHHSCKDCKFLFCIHSFDDSTNAEEYVDFYRSCQESILNGESILARYGSGDSEYETLNQMGMFFSKARDYLPGHKVKINYEGLKQFEKNFLSYINGAEIRKDIPSAEVKKLDLLLQELRVKLGVIQK